MIRISGRIYGSGNYQLRINSRFHFITAAERTQMFERKTVNTVSIPVREYKRLLALQEKVEILKAFYFKRPEILENHVNINAIFNFDNLGSEVDIL